MGNKMLIKFLKHGTGKVSRAIQYLVAEKDAKGQDRAVVEILDGDATWMSLIGDQLNTKYKYTSAVISWEKDDHPTQMQVQETLDEFYLSAFSGLETHRKASYAVLHHEPDGCKHLHVLMLRSDLSTGLAYNPAPPGHEYHFNCLRNYLNHKYDWADPEDPQRKQFYKQSRIDPYVYLREAVVRGSVSDYKVELKRFIDYQFSRGEIQQHTDVCNTLKKFGSIRVVPAHNGRPSYISLKSAHFAKEIRLKGALFEEEFSLERVPELRVQRKQAILGNTVDIPSSRLQQRTEVLFEELQLSRERRAQQNHAIYNDENKNNRRQLLAEQKILDVYGDIKHQNFDPNRKLASQLEEINNATKFYIGAQSTTATAAESIRELPDPIPEPIRARDRTATTAAPVFADTIERIRNIKRSMEGTTLISQSPYSRREEFTYTTTSGFAERTGQATSRIRIEIKDRRERIERQLSAGCLQRIQQYRTDRKPYSEFDATTQSIYESATRDTATTTRTHEKLGARIEELRRYGEQRLRERLDHRDGYDYD